MFGFSKDTPLGKRKKRRSNMEFDFITGPSPAVRPATVKKSPPLTVKPETEPAPSPSAPLPPEPAPEPVFTAADSEPVRDDEPSTEEETMSTFSEPAPIRATESIRRQKKEQGTVNRLLNGVIFGIIAFILLVAAAAGYGGYVMWQQIEGHSVTISQLQASTDKQIAALQRDFNAENQKLAENLALTNQYIVDVERQLADAQKTIETLRRANAQLTQLQNALQTRLQRRLDDQDIAIERIRARQSLR